MSKKAEHTPEVKSEQGPPQLFTVVPGSMRGLYEEPVAQTPFLTSKGLEKVFKDALRKKYQKSATAAAFTGKMEEKGGVLGPGGESRYYPMTMDEVVAQMKLFGFAPANTEEYLRYLLSVNKAAARTPRGTARAYVCATVLDEYAMPVGKDEKTVQTAIKRGASDAEELEALLTAFKEERQQPRYLVATWSDPQSKWYVVAMTAEEVRIYGSMHGRPVFVGVEKGAKKA